MTDPVVRVVHDHAPTIGATFCLRWLTVGQRKHLCCLRPGHRGTCLPLPRFPRTVERSEAA